MVRQAIVQNSEQQEERERDAALRPKWLREVIGQKAVVRRLGIVLKSCKKLKEPLSHILFDGPPGLGKTTFATVLPNELGSAIQMTSGPALSKPADLLPFLTNADEGSFLFIDEIHRMPRVVEEFIYPAMEDFRIDIVLGEGMSARTISMQLKRFTLIGATTRSGMLSGPMRDRFKIREHLDECGPCLRQYGLDQAVKALVARSCGCELAPEDLRAKVLTRIREVRVEISQLEYRPE